MILVVHILLGLATLAHCVYSLVRPRLHHTYSLNVLALATTYTGALLSDDFAHFCLRLGAYLIVILATEYRIYSKSASLALLE